MFECLTVTYEIHLFLLLSGGLLASTLCTDQPKRQASYWESLLRFSLVSMCSFCFRTENSLFSNSLSPLWFITRSFLGPFKCLVFLCFQIICAPPSFNPHFSKGVHWGRQLLPETLGIMQEERKNRDDACKEWHEAALCSQMITKKKKMEEAQAKEEELNLQRWWDVIQRSEDNRLSKIPYRVLPGYKACCY